MSHTRRMISASAVLLVGLAGTPGCEAPPAKPELPTIRSIRGDAPRDDALAIEGDRVTDAAKAEARITEVYLPLDAPLESAWSVVDEEVFPAITRGVWRSNGLRVGLLHEARLADFLDELPRSLGEKDIRFVGYDQRSPLRQSPRLAAQLYADLTVPPFAARREWVSGHRLQLLAALQPRGGGTRVELTPHHHVPRLTLKPRSPLEKQLDGRVFDELAVVVEVPADRYLVLGLYRDPASFPDPPQDDAPPPTDPPTEPAAPMSGVQVRRDAAGPHAGTVPLLLLSDTTPAESETPAADEDGPVQGRIVDRRPPTPVPMHLGRGLFTQPWRGGDVQVLMVIQLSAVR